VLCEQCPTPLTRIGVKDTFGRSGTFDDLIKAYGMDAESVANTIESNIR